MSGTTLRDNTIRGLVIGALVVGAFFGAYRFALAGGGASTTKHAVAGTRPPTVATGAVATGANGAAGATGTAADPGAASGSGCACCGSSSAPVKNGVTGPTVEGVARLVGNVQTVSVNVAGVYSPNVIRLKAGLPAEITFGRATGCTGQVKSADLGFDEDLSAGPKIVKLPALKAGSYAFACGMNMVFGKIIVE